MPACARDAARIREGEKPDVRQIRIGSRLVPYYEAGAALAPYGNGYFMGSAGAAAFFAVHAPGDNGGFGGHSGFGGHDGGGGGFGGGGGGDGGGGN